MSGAVANKVKLNSMVYVTDYGAIGDGSTDDTTAIQNAINYAESIGGANVWLSPGKSYKVTSSILMGDNCGIYSDGTAEIYAPASAFNNATLSNRYATNSSVINCSGQKTAPYTPSTNIRIKGIVIRSEVSDGRMVDAVVAQNVSGFVFEENTITGFPVGCGVRAASLSGRWSISRNYIHTFTDDTDWGAGEPQITAIEIDNDLVNGIASVGGVISENTIRSLTVGSTFLAAHGYETDGINIAKSASQHITISDNIIANVGEGIDLFGSNCTIANNQISQCYIFGIKLIHGASYNVVCGNTIEDVGLAGITLQGSSMVGATDTAYNSISGGTVDSVNYNGAWTASSNACILIADNGGATGKPKYNTITGVVCVEGSSGKYGWLDSSTGTGNYGEGIGVYAGASNTRRVYVSSAGGSCRLSGSGTYSTDLV